jgi:sugar O-acyltransferase (sialic acid O-acetyltransferase NeuD family)
MKVSDAYVCWGGSGHSLVLRDILAEQNAEIVAYIDKYSTTLSVIHQPVFSSIAGFEAWLATSVGQSIRLGVIAIGRQGPDRLEALAVLEGFGIAVPTLISSRACVSSQATVGAGSHILPMAIVASGSRLGRVCIVNHRVVIDHECLLGDSVHVAPGAILCGCVNVGDNVFIGAGAVVLPRVHLGSGSMIGAGAVVTSDVAPGAVVKGNPAR